MVFITGDIHGDTTPVYYLFQKCHPNEDDIIVLLGDVGIILGAIAKYTENVP